MNYTQRVTGEDIVQPRASQTRKKLILSALKSYASDGYHNTTVDEIAKGAGLSVGTAYRYFKDKKALLLGSLEYVFHHIDEFAGIKNVDLLAMDLEEALLIFEKIHKEYRALHEELEGLRHTDPDVAGLYNGFTDEALKDIYDKFPSSLKSKPHSFEDLRIAVGIMENHCHHCMNLDPDDATLRFMRNRTTELVRYIFGQDGLRF